MRVKENKVRMKVEVVKVRMMEVTANLRKIRQDDNV